MDACLPRVIRSESVRIFPLSTLMSEDVFSVSARFEQGKWFAGDGNCSEGVGGGDSEICQGSVGGFR